MTATEHDLTAVLAPANLNARYREVRAATEALAAPLHAEDQVVQSMPDVSPTKWHRAHTTWFFETFLLEPNLRGYTPCDDAYGFLFNSYYEAVGDRHPRDRRGLLSRPTVEQIADYRAHVDHAMDELFACVDERNWPRIAALVELGCNHEQQHQELLLMDIKHVLSCNPLDPPYLPGRSQDNVASGSPASSPQAHPRGHFVEFDGGLVEIGHPGPHAGFAFDNETPRHTVHLAPFRIADRLVTAGEWTEFIDDGGYERPELWLSDGWAAVQREGWAAPLYWQRDGAHEWSAFTLYGRQPLDVHAPVTHVSHYEADAYARWVGARLPIETEWEHAATSSTRPLAGLYDEVWQWTASAYLPYPRFQPADGAVGEYNGKFMSGQMVLRGGASITPQGHTRPTYRNFFPPGSRWMFAGVRLAADA